MQENGTTPLGDNSWMNQQAQARAVIEPPRSSLVKKIFIGAAVLIVIFSILAAYLFFFTGSGETISVAIGAPESLQRGVPTEIAVSVQNSSDAELREVRASLVLPDNIIFVGEPHTGAASHHTIGKLASGELKKESFMVMATGGDNTLGELKAIINYIPGSFRSQVEKEVTKDIILSGTGLELTIGLPSATLSGEEVAIEVSYKNNSTQSFSEAELIMRYPQNFVFKGSSVNPADETARSWPLGVLTPGAAGAIKITGVFTGSDGESLDVSASIGSLVGEVRYDIATSRASISLSPSPISVRVALDSAEKVSAVGAGERLFYRVVYTNNTDITLKDVIIKVKPMGEMFDLRTLVTTGSLRAADNVIIWNASRVSELASLAPGATGLVTFNIETKKTFPITRLSSKNFMLTVHAEAESPTVPAGVAAELAVGIGEITIKMRGALGFSASGFYQDAEAGIVNEGRFPLTVGSKTQFTIHWTLKNTSTDVENIGIKTYLGPNVRYTGQYKSSNNIAPLYNERTQEFSWAIQAIPATKGILSAPVELIFQIELIPSTIQIDTFAELVRASEGVYTDVFTGETRTFTDVAITTRLPDDQSIVGDRRVRE